MTHYAVPFAETMPLLSDMRDRIEQLEADNLSVRHIWDTLEEENLLEGHIIGATPHSVISQVRCTSLDSPETAELMQERLSKEAEPNRRVAFKLLRLLTGDDPTVQADIRDTQLQTVAALNRHTSQAELAQIWKAASPAGQHMLLHNPSFEVSWRIYADQVVLQSGGSAQPITVLRSPALNTELIHATGGSRKNHFLQDLGARNPYLTEELLYTLVETWSMGPPSLFMGSLNLSAHINLPADNHARLSMLKFCHTHSSDVAREGRHYLQAFKPHNVLKLLYPDESFDGVASSLLEQLAKESFAELEVEPFENVATRRLAEMRASSKQVTA